MNVDVHQGSVLSIEVLSLDFQTSRPLELLYADDLVLVAVSLEELSGKFSLNMKSSVTSNEVFTLWGGWLHSYPSPFSNGFGTGHG